ncbi:unnamed protein product, partial [Mesorhabditis belari]
MYFYYTLTAMGIKVPRKISKWVTIIQTTQMLIGVMISCCVLWIKQNTDWKCQQSRANLSLAFLIYTTFLILFLHFYWSTYIRHRSIKSESDKEKKL